MICSISQGTIQCISLYIYINYTTNYYTEYYYFKKTQLDSLVNISPCNKIRTSLVLPIFVYLLLLSELHPLKKKSELLMFI